MWDWNKSCSHWEHRTVKYSNCTNVGLKLFHFWEVKLFFADILIAPMWDWNMLDYPPLQATWFHSNCTNVGLKSWETIEALSAVIDSNCTNVGLKWKHCQNWVPNYPFILIAPMWDWNVKVWKREDGKCFNSNCTNVGLKCANAGRYYKDASILIAPMWDWNQIYLWLSRKLNCILIAPMWDWNLHAMRRTGLWVSYSNCTNVGLKFANKQANRQPTLHSNCTNVGLKLKPCLLSKPCKVILIAPMWDWNEIDFEFFAARVFKF